MNANVPMLNEFAGRNTEEVIRMLNETIRQQQAEIAELKHMNRNWQISENILLLELEKLQHRELTDDVIEQVRVAIMGAAYWCADENMPEAYNAIKVWCGQVLGILDKAQEK